ncbi:S24 family peptidase [Xanthobacter sp.]|uniref:S24 family peptidase n=1 Tax=Xanthobacter sp. TaxID=35809 RepID=UPI0025EC91A5|nr:S24 family peptidase [Xanthobacter sp.]
MLFRPLKDVIVERLTELNRNPFEAARKAEAERNFFNDILTGKKESVRQSSLAKVALGLDLTMAELSARMSWEPEGYLNSAPDLQPKQERTTPLQPEVSHPIDVPHWPTRKIPVFGQAAGGLDEDGRFILNGNKVADVLVLPGLEDVKDAYAVYVYGTSMVPAFKPGATVYVDPSRPIVKGDDVVVQVKFDEHEPPYGFVKEFVARRRGELELYQHNPPEGQEHTITFPLDRVVAVHKIVGNVPR